MSDATLQSGEGLILTLVLLSYVLALTLRRLRWTRPGFHIALPVFVGVTLRFAAVVAINALGSLQAQLRGGDESYFLSLARTLAATPWGHGFLPHGPYQLHTDLFAIQIKALDLSTTAMRVTQIGIATLGLILVCAAVCDLAGPRAARLAAWILALEPASIFFNSELHKEPLMTLASGLVVLGGTKIWQSLDPVGAVLCALGGLIGIETRWYAGWFLVSASVLLLLHAAVRKLDRPMRALPIIYAVALVVFLMTPTLLTVTSRKSLQTLQISQNANTGVSGALSSGTSNSNNLALEQVNFSSRGAVIRNLPGRVFDLVFRPFPWQLQDTSQRLGAVGSVVALFVLAFLLHYAWRRGRRAIGEVGPILYPFLFLLVAYSLSAGNAGTGFRYRTHLVVLAVGMLAVLREHVLQDEVAARESVRTPLEPASPPAPSTPVAV
ncbi:MAG: hypothetical protein ACYCXW_02490 [Solirubrobacteraceae bacterium]